MPDIVEVEPEEPPRRGRPAGVPNYERTPELPPRPFLYTLDQIASLLYVDFRYLKKNYIYYDAWTVGPHYPDFILARNIARQGKPPDWRVPEHELARWLKRKGFRLHQRGWVT